MPPKRSARPRRDSNLGVPTAVVPWRVGKPTFFPGVRRRSHRHSARDKWVAVKPPTF